MVVAPVMCMVHVGWESTEQSPKTRTVILSVFAEDPLSSMGMTKDLADIILLSSVHMLRGKFVGLECRRSIYPRGKACCERKKDICHGELERDNNLKHIEL